MSERVYNFQDILYLNYYTEEDYEQRSCVDLCRKEYYL